MLYSRYQFKYGIGNQPIIDHDIGLTEQAQGLDGQQVGVTRSSTYEINRFRRCVDCCFHARNRCLNDGGLYPRYGMMSGLILLCGKRALAAQGHDRCVYINGILIK